MKRALITGVTGQDGAYLAALLLREGYEVFGGCRRVSSPNRWRLAELGILEHPHLHLIDHDLTDLGSSIRALEHAEPDEVYNLGAQSYVAVSFNQPDLTAMVSAIGALRMLEAVRICNPRIRYYQASSAEMYGKVQCTPQNETTPFYPRSPYGIAKTFAHWATRNYRESYGLFACCGTLFNHESPLRGLEFVTRKISHAVANIAHGKGTELRLGNLDALRDWGYAAEYVDGMRLMLQANEPDDYVLATGKTNSVRWFTEMAFAAIGIQIRWQGEGPLERGYDDANGNVVVRVDPKLFRPAEVDVLVGDATKAQQHLGWTPRTTVSELASMMVAADLWREGAASSLASRSERPPLTRIEESTSHPLLATASSIASLTSSQPVWTS